MREAAGSWVGEAWAMLRAGMSPGRGFPGEFPMHDLRSRGIDLPFARPAPSPTPLWTATLAEVMSPPDCSKAMSDSWDRYVRKGWKALDHIVERIGLFERAEPSEVEGYAIAHDLRERIVAVFEARTGAPAGAVIDGNLHVLKRHQGKGLAPLLIERAFDVGVKRLDHLTVTLSPGGRATRRRAHRNSVRRALERGEAVRDEVLDDYPELRDAAAAPAP
jgi:GNAT superfamily N-acetyltransferase